MHGNQFGNIFIDVRPGSRAGQLERSFSSNSAQWAPCTTAEYLHLNYIFQVRAVEGTSATSKP